MNINTEIEKLINEINNLPKYNELREDDFYDDKIDNETINQNFRNYQASVQLAIDEMLITRSFTFKRNLYLTPLGKKIIRKGGWLKHLEFEDNKTKRETEKDEYDFKTKKWIYKTRFLPYFISGLALIISVLSYFKKDKEATKSVKLKTEIETKKIQSN
jgi:hypothetical protein